MTDPEIDENEATILASQFLRIPTRRIGVVIGKGGVNRQTIEKKTLSKIIIDSDTGEVEIRAQNELEDPVQLLNARDVVKAIGRGFSLTQSMKLTEDSFYLEVIRLKPLVGTQSAQMRRVKSRIIGSAGKTKETIEELTGCSLVVLGGTVSLIGDYDRINDAKDAILNIINGHQVENVLAKLEEIKKQLKKDEQQLWETEEDAKEADEEEEEEEDIFENLTKSEE